MGKKLDAVYNAIIEGVIEGFAGYDLYSFVNQRCENSSRKRFCRASILALSDSRVPDRSVLEGVYALAVHDLLR